MFLHQKVIGALVGALILVGILVMVRKRKITEARAALWLASGVIIFVVSISPALQALFGRAVGSRNMPATILAVGVLFLFTICLDLTVQVTRLSRRLHDLAQEHALLEQQVREGREEG